MAEAARKIDLRDLVACRGLRRETAARYIGVSPTKFDEMVVRGDMPQPKRVDGVKVWDRLALDDAFDRLPSSEESNPWD